jgi:hypothetical protein
MSTDTYSRESSLASISTSSIATITRDKAKESGNTLYIVLGCVGGSILIGAVVGSIVYLLKKKKSKTTVLPIEMRNI